MSAPQLRLGPRVAVLKQGSEKSTGPDHIKSNAQACKSLADTVKVTLGPRGQDVIIIVGDKTTITNDGATILKSLNITHPAARLLVKMSECQDKLVGDGTTSVVLMAAEVLQNLSVLVDSLNTPNSIIKLMKKCSKICQETVDELSIDITPNMDYYLEKCASTSLSSKMISNNSSFFADIAIKAVKTIGPKSSLKLIGIQKQRGASLSDSILVDGFAIPKCFAYAGAKSQPYKFINPKIALIHVELELKAERSNAELKIETASQYQEAIDTEWKILFDKCDALVKSGANIVLSSLPIGDVAYQYFSDRGIYCGGRVAKEEMDRAMFSLGGSIQTSLDNMSSSLGECESFEEIQVGSERYTVFKGGKRSKSCTLILRGSGEFVLDEGKRNLHDALKVVQRIMSNPKVVPGGGAIEMAIAARMKKYSLEKLKGKEIIFMNSIAEALEIIPRILSQNCGFDETEIVSNLNKLHTESKHSYGVNIISKNGIDDNIKSGILEPKDLSMNKFNTLFESIAMVLSVNQTIKAPRLQAESQDMMNAKNALQDRN